jgi:glucose-1-phosphate adenylyltransferase
MDYSRIRRGARLRRVIVDRHNIIEPAIRIGYDAEEDSRRYYVSTSGIVVVPRGEIGFCARDPSGAGLSYSEG